MSRFRIRMGKARYGVPTNSVLPVLGGTHAIGTLQSVTPGTYTNGGVPTSYRWYTSDNVQIPGVTGASWTPVPPYQSRSIYVIEVATGPGGTVSAQSATVGPISTTDPLTAPPAGVTFDVHLNAAYSTVTYSSGSIIATMSDLKGLSPVTDRGTVPNHGPTEMTDGRGYKFHRYDGNNYLTGTPWDGVSTGWTGNTRQYAVYMVARLHDAVSMTLFEMGSVADSTQFNSGGVGPSTSGGTTTPMARFMADSPLSDTTKYNFMLGCQMQAIGGCSRAGAAGTNTGKRISVNDKSIAKTQFGTAADVSSFEIGRHPSSTGLQGSWARMDLYELILVKQASLTDAQHDAIMAALMTAWGIEPITQQIICDGDSRTVNYQSIAYTSGNSFAMAMTDWGRTGALPKNVRVLSYGVSGNTAVQTAARRDVANSAFTTNSLLPGGAANNRVQILVGTNDMNGYTNATPPDSSATAATKTRANILALVSTDNDTGASPQKLSYLRRGFSVQVISELAAYARMPNFSALNPVLNNASFITDCEAPDPSFVGNIRVINSSVMAIGGVQPFLTDPGHPASTYYFDGLHPNATGNALLARGADDPQYSIVGGSGF